MNEISLEIRAVKKKADKKQIFKWIQDGIRYEDICEWTGLTKGRISQIKKEMLIKSKILSISGLINLTVIRNTAQYFILATSLLTYLLFKSSDLHLANFYNDLLDKSLDVWWTVSIST